jgi:hypothetical protein
MNKEQTIEAIKVMQAFVDGKEVEYSIFNNNRWLTTDEPDWSWVSHTYRIKPTPVLRPWTADEVPLGAWMRDVSKQDYRWLIHTSGNADTRKDWLVGYEHSTDGGKTWLPCGVMEESVSTLTMKTYV